tara:strand:+ start:1318 stop:2283 length:966 start_codon:yes stop_codon:yes gene_type:complete
MPNHFNQKIINIYLAAPRGFCAGVERAITMVEEALKKYGKPVYVRHEIVHNKYVVEDLKSKGAIFVEEVNEIQNKQRPIIFSAHGVPKSVPLQAQKLNLVYHDATCPLVSKIHREVEFFKNKNLAIILIGHRNHPEVVGTMGQINSKIYLVEKKSDVAQLKLDNSKTVAYVTQTTLSVDDTQSIIEAIKKRFLNVVEPKKDDICYATTNRQEAVKKIAPKSDLFVVIGAKNSSNSLRLVEVAKQFGAKKSILVEKLEKFDVNSLKYVSNIGLTASASAPEILVQNFIKLISNNHHIKVHEEDYEKENVFFKIPQHLKTKIN